MIFAAIRRAVECILVFNARVHRVSRDPPVGIHASALADRGDNHKQRRLAMAPGAARVAAARNLTLPSNPAPPSEGVFVHSQTDNEVNWSV